MRDPLTLSGCTPEPLMGYLKALGVFRLVAEQKDATATLSWAGGVARLHTTLSREELTDFFLSEYRPTPVIGPWGARSGFYAPPMAVEGHKKPLDNEKAARQALDAIAATTDERFSPFRKVIGTASNILRMLGVHTKEDLDTGDNYLKLLQSLRNELEDEERSNPAGDWLDAVYVLTNDKAVNDGRKFPPLLGTGGNEGSGSYMSNFCQTVAKLLVHRQMDPGVTASVFGTSAVVLADISVGHFDPGAIDGPNSSIGFDGGGGANPWDFLLAIEGTLLFAAKAARRLGTDTDGKAAYPFTVDPTPVGYGSASDAEKVRAEMWMPEWDRPTTYPELTYLMGEGRAQLGRRQARKGLDFARAAVTLGANRGLTAFHRYAFVMRNGLSYFAAYLGRFPVREVPNARLLDELDRWLTAYRKLLKDGKSSKGGKQKKGNSTKKDKAPPRFAVALRRIETAIFDVCRYGDDPVRMQAVLRAVGNAEQELANGAKLRADRPGLRPLAGLSGKWLEACDDGSPEYRLAASLTFMPGRKNRHRRFRMYVEPVQPTRGSGWKFDDNSRGVVWSKADLPSNLGAVLTRRMIDAASEEPGADGGQSERSGHPLWSPARFRPRLSDVLSFIHHRTDDQKITELLWSLPAVSSDNREFRFRKTSSVETIAPIEYAVLKLVFLAEEATRPGTTALVPIRNEPRTATLLRAGRLDEALAVACRRLHAAGFPTYIAGPIAGQMKTVKGFTRDPIYAKRLLAALLFPIGRNAVNDLLELSVRKQEAPQT